MEPGRTSAHPPLSRNPNFLLLLAAQYISLGGDWFCAVALLSLVLQLTGSSMSVSLILVCSTLPMFLLTPVAGGLADRLNRKHVMVVCNLVSTALALGFLLIHRPQDVWIGFAVSALLMSVAAFFEPAATALLPTVVNPQDLSRANALFGSGWGLMLAVGAALGGVVSSRFGRDVAFMLDALSFLVAAGLVTFVRDGVKASALTKHDRPQAPFSEAVTFLTKRADLLLVVFSKAGWGLGSGIIMLLSVFPIQVFHAGDAGVGLLYSFRGMGALLGTLFAPLVVRQDVRRMAMAIGSGMVLVGIFYGLFSSAPTLWFAAGAVLMAHLGAGPVWVFSSTLLQLKTPNRLMGRIAAIDMGIVTLTMAMSQLGAGWLATRFDPRSVGLGCALLVACYGMVWMALWRWVERKAEDPDRIEPGLPQRSPLA